MFRYRVFIFVKYIVHRLLIKSISHDFDTSDNLSISACKRHMFDLAVPRGPVHATWWYCYQHCAHERLHQRLQQQFQGRNLLNFSQCHRPMNFRRTLNLVFFFARAEDTTLSKTCLVRILSAAEHSMKVCPLTSLHKSNPSSKVTWSTSLDSLISTWVATRTMSCFFLRFLMEGIQNSLTFLNDSRSTTL